MIYKNLLLKSDLVLHDLHLDKVVYMKSILFHLFQFNLIAQDAMHI